MKYMLDANVLSELTKPEPNAGVMLRFGRHSLECAICAPVLHELEYGIGRLADGRRKQRLSQFLEGLLDEGLEVLPYDRRAAHLHAIERVRLMRRGDAMPYVYSQIAAITGANNLTLVTRNMADFRRFFDIRLEDWFAV